MTDSDTQHSRLWIITPHSGFTIQITGATSHAFIKHNESIHVGLLKAKKCIIVQSKEEVQSILSDS